MALYAGVVAPASLRINSLAVQVAADMAGGAGVAWWDHLSVARSILIGDYMLALTESVQVNLVEASMHLERTRELWTADSWSTRQGMRTAAVTGRGVFGIPSERDANRRVEADGHVAGFFRAAGSVLDNLGGIVVGVAGLETSIVRAAWSDLNLDKETPRGIAATDPGRALQLELVTAVRDAVALGSTGWSEWTLDLRNTLVHRASRLTMALSDRRQPDGVLRPLPLHPAQSQVESMARTKQLGQDMLSEHGANTMADVLEWLVVLVTGVGAASVNFWDTRRGDPALIRQPHRQWPKLEQGRTSTFRGAHPISLPKLTGGAMVLNPSTAARLRAAQLLDTDRQKWQEWLAHDDGEPERKP